MVKRWVIQHPEYGIFMGDFGRGPVWTALPRDPAIVDSVVTFDSREMALCIAGTLRSLRGQPLTLASLGMERGAGHAARYQLELAGIYAPWWRPLTAEDEARETARQEGAASLVELYGAVSSREDTRTIPAWVRIGAEVIVEDGAEEHVAVICLVSSRVTQTQGVSHEIIAVYGGQRIAVVNDLNWGDLGKKIRPRG